MLRLSNRTKYIIAIIIICVLLISSVCFRFIKSNQKIMSNNIVDIRKKTNFATQYMEDLLDSSSSLESRMISCENLANYISFIKDRLPCIYSIYFNDSPSRHLAIYFDEDMDKFRGFLDKNRQDIISFSLTGDNLSILKDYSGKLNELNSKIDELAKYTDTDKQMILVSSLIIPRTEFKRILALSMITFYEPDNGK